MEIVFVTGLEVVPVMVLVIGVVMEVDLVSYVRSCLVTVTVVEVVIVMDLGMVVDL